MSFLMDGNYRSFTPSLSDMMGVFENLESFGFAFPDHNVITISDGVPLLMVDKLPQYTSRGQKLLGTSTRMYSSAGIRYGDKASRLSAGEYVRYVGTNI